MAINFSRVQPSRENLSLTSATMYCSELCFGIDVRFYGADISLVNVLYLSTDKGTVSNPSLEQAGPFYINYQLFSFATNISTYEVSLKDSITYYPVYSYGSGRSLPGRLDL